MKCDQERAHEKCVVIDFQGFLKNCDYFVHCPHYFHEDEHADY